MRAHSVSGGPTKRLAAVAFIAYVLCAPAQAQNSADDPIDIDLKACLESSGSTTAGMISCTGKAVRSWDRKLNDVYQRSLKELDPKSADLLRASQRRWVAFRESEHAVHAGPWRNNRGTMINTELMQADLSAIRERVSELEIYAEDGG